jgi:acetyl esterase
LQAKTPVDLSGVTVSEKTIAENGRRVNLYVMRPAKATGVLPVLLFIHGGVWIAGDFENHKRLVRDLVVGSGAAAVFVEYTPIPDAVFPTQVEQNYAAATWSSRMVRRLASTAAESPLPEIRWAGIWRRC